MINMIYNEKIETKGVERQTKQVINKWMRHYKDYKHLVHL